MDKVLPKKNWTDVIEPKDKKAPPKIKQESEGCGCVGQCACQAASNSPEAQAEQLGRAAFKAGKKAIPAWDAELMKLIAATAGKPMGASLPLLDAWIKGWHDENLKAPVEGWTAKENEDLQRNRTASDEQYQEIAVGRFDDEMKAEQFMMDHYLESGSYRKEGNEWVVYSQEPIYAEATKRTAAQGTCKRCKKEGIINTSGAASGLCDSCEDDLLRQTYGEREAAQFGSVEWQEAMEKRVMEKKRKGLPLDDSEEAFVETQGEHNKRMVDEQARTSRKEVGQFTKKATGEPDQDYDHELYDGIATALAAEGYEASHKEFDKYQGVYLKVRGHGVYETFWTEDVFFSGEREGDPAATTFTYKPGTEQAHYIFYPESQPDVKIQYDAGGDVSDFVSFMESKQGQKKGATMTKVALKLWEHPADYMGEDYPDYYVGPSQTRDSDTLERSNFKSALAMLGGEKDGVMVARFNHWAVGWVETILVHKDSKDKVAILEDIEKQMANYPVLDDDDYSQTEMEEYREDYESWAKDEALGMIKKHLMATAPAGDHEMAQRIEDYQLSETADRQLYDDVINCFMDHGEPYFDEKTLIENADDVIATILQETGSKAQVNPAQQELPLEGLSSKKPVWIKTAKNWEVCTECGGDGYLELSDEEGGTSTKECPACEGTGRLPLSTEASMEKKADEKRHPYITWDTGQIAEDEAKYFFDEPESNDHWMEGDVAETWEEAGHDTAKFKELLKAKGLEGTAEKQAQESAWEDSDIVSIEWDTLVSELSTFLEQKNPSGRWLVSVEGFGWRKLNGQKIVNTNDGQTFLREVLPDTDVTFYIYDDGGAKFSINNFHHDSPTGEWYYAEPAPSEEVIDAESSQKSWTKAAAISKQQRDAVEQSLTNDEASSDEELVEHFINELKMSAEDAAEWVAKRDTYLNIQLCQKCHKPGEPQHDRYGIYEGIYCEKCYQQAFNPNWKFDPADAGESLEEDASLKVRAGMVKRLVTAMEEMGIKADFADEHGIADDAPAVEDLVQDETPMEPEEGDVIIQSEGPLGSQTVAYADRKPIAKLQDDWDKFYGDIYAWMKKKNYYPNVWLLSDHGNVSEDTGFGEYVGKHPETKTAGSDDFDPEKCSCEAKGERCSYCEDHYREKTAGSGDAPSVQYYDMLIDSNLSEFQKMQLEDFFNSDEAEELSIEDLKAMIVGSRTAGRDEEIVKRNMEQEQAAVDEYRGQAQDASPKLKKVLDHIVEQEEEHKKEFESKKIMSAISPEERVKYTWMAKNLKSVLKPILGIPISVKTSGSVRPNPYIEVSSVDWETNKIPNDFRAKVAKALGIEPTSWENVTYGNITDNRVALPSSEWKKVLDSLGIQIPEQPAGGLPTKTSADESYQGLGDFVGAYLEAALWSSTDNADESGGEPLDANYDFDDIAPESLERAKADCAAFQEKAGDLLGQMNDDQAGHDFWLTRNGHGAGFWDRGLGDVGDQLTEIAHGFGEVNLIVGDDNKLYLEGSMNKTAYDDAEWECPKCGDVLETHTEIALHNKSCDGKLQLSKSAAVDDTTKCKSCGKDFDFTGLVYCPECATVIERQERAYNERLDDPQFDVEAGLSDQVKSLRRKLKDLDVEKADPSEIASTVDALEKLEKRLKDQQDARQTKKDEKAKAAEEAKTVEAGAPEPVKPAEGATREQKIQQAIEMLSKDPDIIEIVKNIEKKMATTKGHYGDYMRVLDDYKKNRTMMHIVAEALINAGANAEGVQAALGIMSGSAFGSQVEPGKCARCGTASGGKDMCDTCKKHLKETMNAEAGLSDQVKTLRKKLKELDVDKADPSEIASIVDALEKMEKRLKEQQETRKTNKEEKAKAAEEAAKTEATASLYAKAATNEDVIRMFADDSFPKDKMPTWGTQHLKINKEPNGWALINYNTPIAYRSNDGKTFINTQKYSVTTSKIQNVLKAAMGGASEVDEAGMKAAMSGQPEKTASLKDGKIVEADMSDFFDYCWSFYGPGEIYGEYFNNELKEEDLKKAINEHFQGDTVDREAVRDILFTYPQYKRKKASLNKVATEIVFVEPEGNNGLDKLTQYLNAEFQKMDPKSRMDQMEQRMGVLCMDWAEANGYYMDETQPDKFRFIKKELGRDVKVDLEPTASVKLASLIKQASNPMDNPGDIGAQELANGDLEISVGEQSQKELAAYIKETDDTSDGLMYDVFEHLMGNGYTWLQPEDIGALTDAPIMTDGGYADDGMVDLSGGAKVWWYPNYAVRSPMQDLAETGKVVFTLAPEDKEVESSQKRYAKYFEQFKSSDLAGSAWELDKESRKLKRKKMNLKIQSTADFFKSGGYKFKEGDMVWLITGDKAQVIKRHAAAMSDHKEYDAVVLDSYGHKTGSAFKISEKDLEPA